MVRLISENGSATLLSEIEVNNMARNRGLDVVIVDDRNEIPTVKILDYGKYQYDLAKKKKASAKAQKTVQVKLKEIQLRPVTGINDIKIKAESAKRFLSENNQVKIVVKFRGREINNMQNGVSILEQFLEFVSEYKIVQEMRVNGRDASTIICKN